MIIIGNTHRIARISLETIALADLILILHKDNAFVYKDRYGNQRFVDFPEVAELLQFYLSEFEVEDSIEKETGI